MIQYAQQHGQDSKSRPGGTGDLGRNPDGLIQGLERLGAKSPDCPENQCRLFFYVNFVHIHAV